MTRSLNRLSSSIVFILPTLLVIVPVSTSDQRANSPRGHVLCLLPGPCPASAGKDEHSQPPLLRKHTGDFWPSFKPHLPPTKEVLDHPKDMLHQSANRRLPSVPPLLLFRQRTLPCRWSLHKVPGLRGPGTNRLLLPHIGLVSIESPFLL